MLPDVLRASGDEYRMRAPNIRRSLVATALAALTVLAAGCVVQVRLIGHTFSTGGMERELSDWIS